MTKHVLKMTQWLQNRCKHFINHDTKTEKNSAPIIVLKFVVNGLPKPLEHDEVKYIKQELRRLRDTVNRVLDRLEPPQSVTSTAEVSPINGNGNYHLFLLLFSNGIA